MSRTEKWNFLEKALPITFLLTTLGAILAISMGWFLAEGGGYNEDTLFWHRILGIVTALLSGMLYLQFTGRLGQHKLISQWGLFLGVILLTLTGHLGGQLTHGSAYLLDYAPAIVKQTLGAKESKNQQLIFPINPDSTFLYAHLIQAVFDEKCVSCHNSEHKRGGLNLATKDGLLAGGDHGDVLEAKPQQGSLLLHRVTLESDNPKYMPPKGIPLDYAEIRLLEYWLNNGYSFEQAITDEGIPQTIRQLILREYGLSNKRRSYVEQKQVPAADPDAIQALVEIGFTIKPLAQTSNFLEVTFRDTLDCAQLEKLASIKTQISWLNLSRTGMSGDCLEYLKDLSNLTRLQLSQNPIDNAGIIFLKDLKHLESLNLYGTAIDEQGLSPLKKLEQLQRLYLGQTKIDSAGREAVQLNFSSVEVVLD